MKRWIVDRLLPAVVMGLVAALVQTYVDVQVLKHDIRLLRAELSDLWTQANDQIQQLHKHR